MKKNNKKNGADKKAVDKKVIDIPADMPAEETNPVDLKKKASDMAATIRKAAKIKKEGDSILSGLYNKAEARKTKRSNRAAVPSDKQAKTYADKIAALQPDYEAAARLVKEHEEKVAAVKAELGIKDRAPRKVTFSVVRGQIVRRTALRTALGKNGFTLTPDTAIREQFVVHFNEDGWTLEDTFKQINLANTQEYGAGSMKLIKDILKF
jgi:hypothetical protein